MTSITPYNHQEIREQFVAHHAELFLRNRTPRYEYHGEIEMKLDQIRILKLLEEVSQSEYTSQRYLSQKLNISLGLVNSFIKRLAKKGYFKVSTLPKNRLKYILTPKGIAEKTRLTYEYLHFSFEFYRTSRSKILETFRHIENEGLKKIVFYGSGELSEISYILIHQTNLRLVAITDPENHGEQFMRKPIIHPDELETLDYDMILLTKFIERKTMNSFAESMNIPSDKILPLR